MFAVDAEKIFSLFFCAFCVSFVFHNFTLFISSTNLRFYLVFNLCLSDLLPLNYECSARMFNEDHGRYQRDANFSSSDKCERVDPAKRRMLREKFEIAESYLGRFIGNILKHFTDERKVQGVRRSDPILTLCIF